MRRRPFLSLVLMSWLLLLALRQHCLALDVAGTIKDSVSSSGISGAKVIILEIADTTQTDALGKYFFANVAEGFYTFLIGSPNYSPRIMAHVRVSASCCIGNRGDFNNDGIDANIIDLTFLVDRIFRGGPAPICPIESDINSDGASANIIDLTFLVDRIFRGGPAPGPCI